METPNLASIVDVLSMSYRDRRRGRNKFIWPGNDISLYGNATVLLGNDMLLFGNDSCALRTICFWLEMIRPCHCVRPLGNPTDLCEVCVVISMVTKMYSCFLATNVWYMQLLIKWGRGKGAGACNTIETIACTGLHYRIKFNIDYDHTTIHMFKKKQLAT